MSPMEDNPVRLVTSHFLVDRDMSYHYHTARQYHVDGCTHRRPILTAVMQRIQAYVLPIITAACVAAPQSETAMETWQIMKRINYCQRRFPREDVIVLCATEVSRTPVRR